MSKAFSTTLRVYVAIILFLWTLWLGATGTVGLNASLARFQVGGKYLETLESTNVLSVWLILALVLCASAVLCAERQIQRFIGAVGCVAITYTGFLAGTLSFRLAAPMAFLVIGFFVVASGCALLQWISALLFGAGGISLGGCVAAAVSDTGKASELLFASVILLVAGVAIWKLIEHLEEKKPRGKKGISKRWSSAWLSVIVCLGAASLAAVYFIPTDQLKELLYELHEMLQAGLKIATTHLTPPHG